MGFFAPMGVDGAAKNAEFRGISQQPSQPNVAPLKKAVSGLTCMCLILAEIQTMWVKWVAILNLEAPLGPN